MFQVLLVEPDAVFGSLLSQVVSDLADVWCVLQFAAARSIIQQSPVDLLVTNLRLGAFNGLHLVHLAALMATQTRAVVYTERLDLGFGQEIQRAGAFYDTRPRLPHTLASYVGAALPPQDRRHLAVDDRRQRFRGGRRAADRPEFHGLVSG
jgi:DNA-binding NtrC family response regulator